MVASAYGQGFALNPVDGASFAYVSATVSVTVTSSTQSVFVSGQAAMGSTVAGGANGLDLSVCRSQGGALTDNADFLEFLRVPQNTRISMAVSGRFTGLTPGTYTFGVCGRTSTGNAVNWNNQDWSRVAAYLFNQ